jgi:NodT family efflux transporter outer membrane factor (OMF) lipoprotein
MMCRPARIFVAILAAGSIAGCVSVGPDFVAPREPVPDRYAGAAATTTDPAAKERPDGSFWWKEFHDAELDRLEALASDGNLDLKVAYLRIVESRAEVMGTRAQGLPSLNASAQYTREQVGFAGILKSQGFAPSATTPAAETNLLDSLEKPVNLYQLGFDASWELDLFGRVRRAVEAAKAQSQQAIESRNDLLVTLRADVAQTYLQLRAAQVLEATTRDLIAKQRDIVALTEERRRHGLTSEVDVQSARAQLSSLESQLPPYDQTVVSARHALAVLTGQPPEALDGEFGDTGDLPSLPAEADVGIPSTLARRRPDIRSAEASLHAATAQIGVSVAAMYPDISLTGSYGLRNLGTGYLFDWSSRFYTAGPRISLPIFKGGALVANVRISKTEAAVAAVNYRKTVLAALQEVEDGLTSLHDDAERTAALKETVGADQRAVEIDLDAYRRGLVSYVTVLQLQLQDVQARQQLAQALLAQSTDVVKLYKALGGGWEDAPMPGGPSG